MTTTSHLTRLETEAAALLRLLEKAAKASPDHTTATARRRLVGDWLYATDRFAPSQVLEDHGDATSAAHLTSLCTHGDYSPTRWRLARKQFTDHTPPT